MESERLVAPPKTGRSYIVGTRRLTPVFLEPQVRGLSMDKKLLWTKFPHHRNFFSIIYKQPTSPTNEESYMITDDTLQL